MTLETPSGSFRSRAAWIASILCVLVLILMLKDDYWRPYTDTPQESVASFHAHSFAVASWGGGLAYPLVAKTTNIEKGEPEIYNHWPSGFFGVLYLAIRAFGNTEFIGRTTAVALNLMGALLAAFAFRGISWTATLMVPLFVLSPIGRDAIPTVFVDASLLFWVGALLVLAASRGRIAKFAFRISVLVAPLFCPMVAFYALWIILVCWYRDRDRKTSGIDGCVWISSAALLVFALSWIPAGMGAGLRELTLQFLHRTSLEVRYDEHVSFPRLILVLCFHLWYNLGPAVCLLPYAWWQIVSRKEAMLSSLLPGVLAYSFLMRNYVGVHIFANLLLVFAALLTLVIGLDIAFSNRARWTPLVWAGVVFSVALAPVAKPSLTAQIKPRVYVENESIADLRAAFQAYMREPGNPSSGAGQPCARFEVLTSSPLPEQDVDRIAQFYLADLVRSVRGGATCTIDLRHTAPAGVN